MLDRPRLRRSFLAVLLAAPLAASAVASCRDSTGSGPASRPARPTSQVGAAADAVAPAGIDRAAREAEPRAGAGLEAVRAAVRGLVMLQETIGETTALRAILPQGPDAPLPDAAAVQTALESFRLLARMEAAGATALGLEAALPLGRTAREAARWADSLATAAGAPDGGTASAARWADLANHLRALDDELRMERANRRADLEADVSTLSGETRRAAACLAAAADALYAWDLVARDIETRTRRAATETAPPAGAAEDAGRPEPAEPAAEVVGAAAIARGAAVTWRSFIDSGSPPGAPPSAASLPAAMDAAQAADAKAREACRDISINALPPPGEDVPALPGLGRPHRSPR